MVGNAGRGAGTYSRVCWQVHREADLAPLARLWARAQAAAPHHVFQQFAFACQWAACFGREAEICIGWQAALPLIVPLARRDGRWGMIGEGLFDYLDVLGAADAEGQSTAAAWAREQMQDAACISGVAETTAYAGFWGALGLPRLPFAAAPVRAAGADCLAAEHPRVARRWQAAHATLQLLEGRERLKILDWLLLHKADKLAAQGCTNVLGAAEVQWLRRMVEHELQLSELWALRRNGHTLAGLLCWLSHSVRYAYTISYDPAAAELSPGILALFALLRHTMREGRSFNFLTGEQAFKRRFATHCDSLLRFQNEPA